MPDTPAPAQENRALKEVLAQVGRLTGNLQKMGLSVEALRGHLDRMAQLAGRTNAALMLLAGLPRMFRSDVYHALALGNGRNNPALYGALGASLGRRGGGISLPGGKGGGSGGGAFYDYKEALAAKLLGLQAQKQAYLEIRDLKRKDRAEEEAHWRKVREEAARRKADERAASAAYWANVHQRKLAEKQELFKLTQVLHAQAALPQYQEQLAGLALQQNEAFQKAFAARVEAQGSTATPLGDAGKVRRDESAKASAGPGEPAAPAAQAPAGGPASPGPDDRGLGRYHVRFFDTVSRRQAVARIRARLLARAGSPLVPPGRDLGPGVIPDLGLGPDKPPLVGPPGARPPAALPVEHVPELLGITGAAAQARHAKHVRDTLLARVKPEHVPGLLFGTGLAGEKPDPTDEFEFEKKKRAENVAEAAKPGIRGVGAIDTGARRRQELLRGEHGKLNQVLAQGSRAAQHARVAWGKLNKGVTAFFDHQDREGGPRRRDVLRSVGQGAATGLLVGSSLAGAALQAGSPVAFDTLIGSVKLLAAQFGGVLMPAALELSLGLQQLAGWVGGLSDGTKNTIGAIAKWTLVGLAAVVVVTKFLAAIELAQKALQLLSTNTGKGALAMAAVALALAALYAAYERSKQQQEALGQAADRRQRAVSGQSTEDDLGEAAGAEGQQYLDLTANLDRPANRKMIQERIKRLRGELGASDAEESGFSRASGSALGVFSDHLGNIPGLSLVKHHAEGVENRVRKGLGLGREGDAEDERVKGGKSYAETAEKAVNRGTRIRETIRLYEDALKGKVHEPTQNARLSEAQGLLLSLQSVRGQAAYSGVEEAYKKTQVESLNKDPLQQALDRIHREQIPKIIERLGQLLGLSGDQVQAQKRAYGVAP